MKRRDAIKRMGMTMAGMLAAGAVPAWAKSIVEREGLRLEGEAGRPQVDDAKVSTLKMKDYKLVYEGPDVVFHQINDHLWVGNGHLMYNESVYLVEGEKRALLIDTGTRMDHLDEIVAGLTSKPVTVALTHTHGDHAGAVKWFDEIWAMQEGVGQLKSYKGKVNLLKNHQMFDLGGRKLEVVFTPGHTNDSAIFVDKEAHMALSGDAFGSTNLLMTQPLPVFIRTAKETLELMNKQGIYYMLPGHFDGENAETSKRIFDLLTVAQGVLDGRLKGEPTRPGLGGINRIYTYEGVRFNYKEN